jgi:hypothetical protein
MTRSRRAAHQASTQSDVRPRADCGQGRFSGHGFAGALPAHVGANYKPTATVGTLWDLRHMSGSRSVRSALSAADKPPEREAVAANTPWAWISSRGASAKRNRAGVRTAFGRSPPLAGGTTIGPPTVGRSGVTSREGIGAPIFESGADINDQHYLFWKMCAARHSPGHFGAVVRGAENLGLSLSSSPGGSACAPGFGDGVERVNRFAPPG